jgi:hypothetical protein
VTVKKIKKIGDKFSAAPPTPIHSQSNITNVVSRDDDFFTA